MDICIAAHNDTFCTEVFASFRLCPTFQVSSFEKQKSILPLFSSSATFDTSIARCRIPLRSKQAGISYLKEEQA